jgi:hypothetical protein
MHTVEDLLPRLQLGRDLQRLSGRQTSAGRGATAGVRRRYVIRGEGPGRRAWQANYLREQVGRVGLEPTT